MEEFHRGALIGAYVPPRATLSITLPPINMEPARGGSWKTMFILKGSPVIHVDPIPIDPSLFIGGPCVKRGESDDF